MGNRIGVFRHYEMTPYWKQKIDFPFDEMTSRKEYAEVKENDMDRLFQLVPDVPILKMETHNFPKYDESKMGCCPQCLRFFKFDTLHYNLVLYTPIGVFMVDRYKKSIDISFQTDEQHYQFINKPNDKRYKPYYDYKGRVRYSTIPPNKSMHDLINVLKRHGSRPYQYLFNNCIKNTDSWYNELKKP